MSTHPHFDDRGTLTWYTSLEAARSVAARDGKLLLLEMGREL